MNATVRILAGSRPAGPESLELVGGKAFNLARLRACGQRVPPWYTVTTWAFRDAVRRTGLERRLRELDDDEAVRALQEAIRGLELPAELAADISRCHGEEIPAGALVAVRSSAVGEDDADASFAGLHDSFLYVGERQLHAAIRKVWASAFNPRALAYRRLRALPADDVAVGVVVQQMVDAAKSGVMFTVNPTTSDVREVVVSSLYGAGEGLVSVGLDADTFTVDKSLFDRGEKTLGEGARREIACKEERLLLDEEAGAGLRRVPVPESERRTPSLNDDELRAVVAAGLEIETFFRRPQDVEFSFDRDGRLYVLQARPVTTVAEHGPAAGHPLTWDNSNIIESYSGVTSPMTFSFIRHAYSIVYHCFAEVMGIHPRVVRENRFTFENMLGLIRGQVYYNLENWYRLIRLFPGFDYNREFMESMMGVRESARPGADEAPAPSLWRRYFVELPALVRLVLRSSWNFLRIRRLVGRFEENFREHYAGWSARDFSAMAPHELLALYREMEEKLLWQWKAPIVNDFFVMIFYGSLKKLCTAWCGDESGSLQNDLVCGEGGIESTKPTRMLLELARDARRDPELRRFLLEHSPDEAAARLPREERFAELQAGIRRYLDLYGFRCVDELKLEEPSLKDRPAFVYQVLANYLRMDDEEALDPAAAEERERRIRRAAELRAFARLGFLRRRIFRRVLANARMGVKNRENMRFARTRIYGLLRELLRAQGETFAREALLDEVDDVFYLTIDEVWSFIQGTAVTTDLRALAALRRREFGSFRDDREAMPDDRFGTFGMVCYRNRFKARRPPPAAAADGVLQGIGCCPGVVTGPVKVLRSPAEEASLAGEILVAERTDPGWVPLYPAVSGLLIERGSILSHSAIVAREMGVPTIVGIPGLTATLASGQLVTMDGAAGTVRLAEGPATDESKAGSTAP
ncbi:MAG TPA: PEP/pyruvate-binding domain-containing protein [Thermoanaerobaculia bacterium]